MPNLGSFAGGLADGIAAGSNLRMKKQQIDNDKDYSDKVIALKQGEDTRAAQRQGWEARDQDRKTAMQADMDAHFKKFADVYGGPATPDASASAGAPAAPPVAPAPNLGGGSTPPVPAQPVTPVTPGSVGATPAPAPTTGNLGSAATPTTSSAPTATPAPTPTDNATLQARRLAAASDTAAIHMRYSGDPTEVLKMTDYLKKNADDDHLRLMRKALNGSDPDAFSSIVKEYGGDPTKANVDMSKGTIDMGNGKPPVDLGMFLRIGGAGVLADELDANKKSKQSDQKFDSSMKNDQSERALHGAQANEANARASVAGMQKTAMIDEKKQRDLDLRIGRDVGYQPDATTGGPGQKAAEWTDGRRWLSQRVTQDLGADPKANLNAVYTKHLADFNTIKSDVDSDWRQLTGPVKASLVDKYKDAPSPEMAAKQAYMSSQLDNSDEVLGAIKTRKSGGKSKPTSAAPPPPTTSSRTPADAPTSSPQSGVPLSMQPAYMAQQRAQQAQRDASLASSEEASRNFTNLSNQSRR